jgi:hypothetical protein
MFRSELLISKFFKLRTSVFLLTVKTFVSCCIILDDYVTGFTAECRQLLHVATRNLKYVLCVCLLLAAVRLIRVLAVGSSAPYTCACCWQQCTLQVCLLLVAVHHTSVLAVGSGAPYKCACCWRQCILHFCFLLAAMRLIRVLAVGSSAPYKCACCWQQCTLQVCLLLAALPFTREAYRDISHLLKTLVK